MKHTFNAEYVHSLVGPSRSYHIGLRFDGQHGRYIWQEKGGYGVSYPLDPDGFQAWWNGVEDHAHGYNVMTNTQMYWANMENATGLRKSYDVHLATNATKSRPSVFVIAASAYKPDQEDPKPFANKLKSEGHTIVVILARFADAGNDEQPFELLSEIASEGYAIDFSFMWGAGSFNDLSSFLCNANCVCPTGWARVEDRSSTPPTPFGSCVQVSVLESDWTTAAKDCSAKAKGTGFLASVRSRLKHEFISNYVRATKLDAVPYHIGLSRNETSAKTAYYWQETSDNGTHKMLRSGDFQPWAEGASDAGSAVQVAPKGQAMMWFSVDPKTVKSYYVCEIAACDSVSYCDEATLSGA
ncbi:CBN-CLEC-62 protein [Aphelenchoides avenae]|nr:CBN-CLEC-62 protein [Aphelenchus avenae]